MNNKMEENIKVIDHKVDETGYNVLIHDLNADVKVWIDVWIDDDNQDVMVDWNKYIFYTTYEEDVKEEEYQSDCDNFELCTSVARNFIEDNHYIYQDNKGLWFNSVKYYLELSK